MELVPHELVKYVLLGYTVLMTTAGAEPKLVNGLAVAVPPDIELFDCPARPGLFHTAVIVNVDPDAAAVTVIVSLV